MFELNKLKSSGKKRRRIGRGGSRGGTSGKGNKGQKARSGPNLKRGFEGGQMPLHRRLPKRGFNNYNFDREFSIVNLEQLERSFKEGEIITPELLIESGLVVTKMSAPKMSKKGIFIKILGKGVLNKKFTVQAHAYSVSAKEAIEKCGGTVQVIDAVQVIK